MPIINKFFKECNKIGKSELHCIVLQDYKLIFHKHKIHNTRSI
jgi:hypothetical protein